jgi:hypothetical protein
MESFVLAETFKYLYLLFDPGHPVLGVGAGGLVWTTEAHPLPVDPRRRPRSQHGPFATRVARHDNLLMHPYAPCVAPDDSTRPVASAAVAPEPAPTSTAVPAASEATDEAAAAAESMHGPPRLRADCPVEHHRFGHSHSGLWVPRHAPRCVPFAVRDHM